MATANAKKKEGIVYSFFLFSFLNNKLISNIYLFDYISFYSAPFKTALSNYSHTFYIYICMQQKTRGITNK